MAEFDPLDPRESAYRDALLQDEAGRQARHARLMAALPRLPAAETVPVAPSTLARRWQPYALGLLASALLLAAVLVVFRTRTAEPPAQAEPALVTSPAASAATVVAQADTAAAATEPSRPAARKGSTGARAAVPRTEASLPLVAKPSVVAEPEAAPVVTAAAPAAQMPDTAASVASPRAEALARAELPVQTEVARSGSLANSLVASGVRVPAPANAMLLDAASRGELDNARSALAAGASVHARDAQGRTALMLAARAGSGAAAEMLLAAGARKADRDAGGLTAADHARAQGHADLADRLR